ncbi:hypothetical protein [Adhaeribacter aquaticus]|uniref:hypothetical protein n=1 Tax=Adhaeribacter aquaticus TaxID=299567 RepID=UPI00041BD6C7|nr:hypothetical protein [Adhaeribacter aquaticus]
MKNYLFIIFFAFSLFLAIFYYSKFSSAQQALELANRRVLDRDTMIFQLQKKVQGQLGVDINSQTNVKAPGNLGHLSTSEIENLKGKGLKNPNEDLKQSLIKNQQNLIKVNGSVGGTMNIREVQILNNRYALAYFEDGHIGGYMMLRYEVKSSTDISWQVLDQYIM